MSFDSEDMISRELNAMLYSRADLDEARRRARDQGREDGKRWADDRQWRWGAMAGALAFAAAIAGVLGFTHLHLNDAPGHQWVDVYGQRCVQVPHPDYNPDDTMTPERIVLCERVPEQALEAAQ